MQWLNRFMTFETNNLEGTKKTGKRYGTKNTAKKDV
jgi:hypothetical protein